MARAATSTCTSTREPPATCSTSMRPITLSAPTAPILAAPIPRRRITSESRSGPGSGTADREPEAAIGAGLTNNRRRRMGKVLGGMTVSLAGFVNDRTGDVSRLYPDLEALRQTPLLQEAMQTVGAVVLGGVLLPRAIRITMPTIMNFRYRS